MDFLLLPIESRAELDSIPFDIVVSPLDHRPESQTDQEN
jgi:hypothetical protein